MEAAEAAIAVEGRIMVLNNNDDDDGRAGLRSESSPNEGVSVHIVGEVVFACREYACTVEYMPSRRTRLACLNKEAAIETIPVVADIMGTELGWTSQVRREQIEAARTYMKTYGAIEETVRSYNVTYA